jgi:hypothetical protein
MLLVVDMLWPKKLHLVWCFGVIGLTGLSGKPGTTLINDKLTNTNDFDT